MHACVSRNFRCGWTHFKHRAAACWWCTVPHGMHVRESGSWADASAQRATCCTQQRLRVHEWRSVGIGSCPRTTVRCCNRSARKCFAHRWQPAKTSTASWRQPARPAGPAIPFCLAAAAAACGIKQFGKSMLHAASGRILAAHQHARTQALKVGAGAAAAASSHSGGASTLAAAAAAPEW